MRYIPLLFVLALTACNTAPDQRMTRYTPPATPGGRLCMEQCNKSRDYCQESCDLDYRACYNDMHAAAQNDYDHYADERFASHLKATLLPSDFEHPAACLKEKKSCYSDCDHPYNSCYRSCGGTVTVTSPCQLLCFE